MNATIIHVRGYNRNRRRCRIDDEKHTQLRIDLALEEWERTFPDDALRQIEAENPSHAQRIRETH